jgi:hypothetical protein
LFSDYDYGIVSGRFVEESAWWAVSVDIFKHENVIVISELVAVDDLLSSNAGVGRRQVFVFGDEDDVG